MQVSGVRHRVGPPSINQQGAAGQLGDPLADPDLWTHDQFQLLLVAAEYVAALQEVGKGMLMQRPWPGRLKRHFGRVLAHLWRTHIYGVWGGGEGGGAVVTHAHAHACATALQGQCRAPR